MEVSNINRGYKITFGYIGRIILMMGLIMLLPLAVLPFFPEERVYLTNFLIPGIIVIILGISLSSLVSIKQTPKLSKNHDAIIVVTGWIIAVLLCTLPFLFKNDSSYSFTRSVFEVVSSLTTSGITLFNVEDMARIYLFYRSLLLFFGGMGIVIAIISLFKESSGMALYNAEGHDSRLLGNIRSTARFIFITYLMFIIFGTIAYVSFGMGVFDAIVHSISAVGTAGFSTRTESIAYFNSLGIEITTIILMLAGATSFMAHLYLFKRKFKQVARYNEVKAMFTILFIVIMVFALYVFFSNTDLTIRQVVFQSVSALTGTAFFIVPIHTIYAIVPAFFTVIFVLIMIGGSSNSSSGGIKLYRISIIFKNIKWQLSDALNPGSNLKRGKYIYSLDGKSYLDEKKIIKIHSYVFLYIVLMFIIAISFSIFSTDQNITFSSTLFEATSILSTSGFSLGVVNYYASNVILWISIFGMFFGRLEIFVIIVCFVKISKDIKNKANYY